MISGAVARTLLIIGALAGLGALWAEVRRRARRATMSSIVLSGLAVVGLYLGLIGSSAKAPDASSQGIARPAPVVSPLASGDIAQVRNVTRGTSYGDPVVAATDELVRYRLRLENISNSELDNVWVRLAFQEPGSYAVIRPSFASLSNVRHWPDDTATVNFDNSSGPLMIERKSARVTDAAGRLTRRLPTGIDQAGVNIGDIGVGATLHVEVLARMPRSLQGTQPQIEGGDILWARNLSRGGTDWHDPVLADLGDRLLLRYRVHNANPALSDVTLRARLPRSRATFAKVKVTASSDAADPRATSDTVTVNFAGGRRLRLVPRYGTTEWFAIFGHEDSCPKPSEVQPLEDGIDQGGIVIGPVGYADLDDDCSESIAFVDFQLRVVR